MGELTLCAEERLRELIAKEIAHDRAIDALWLASRELGVVTPENAASKVINVAGIIRSALEDLRK